MGEAVEVGLGVGVGVGVGVSVEVAVAVRATVRVGLGEVVVRVGVSPVAAAAVASSGNENAKARGALIMTHMLSNATGNIITHWVFRLPPMSCGLPFVLRWGYASAGASGVASLSAADSSHANTTNLMAVRTFSSISTSVNLGTKTTW